MNKPMIITTAVAAVSVTAIALSMNAYYKDLKDLYNRFPNLDRKIIRKAYNKFMLDAIMQKTDVAYLDHRQMDLMFLTYITKVTI